MAINYDEVIAELRAEETRLTRELKQVQDAIPAMIALRNRSKSQPSQTAAPRVASNPGARRFARMGATEAITLFLKGIDPTISSTTREVLDGLHAAGWTSKAKIPLNVVRATLTALVEKEMVEKVGEAWRAKVSSVSLNPSTFSSNEQQQPLTQ